MKWIYLIFVITIVLALSALLLRNSISLKSEKQSNQSLISRGPVNECENLETEVKELVNDANYCTIDSDCTYEIAVGYPADCNPLVNINSDIKSIEEAYLNYANKCSPPIYDCDVHPSQNEMKCIDSRCIDTRYAN